MGGRGSSSASRQSKSSTTAWQDMVAEMGAAAPPASDYDSLESRIPDWFLDKTFTSFGERYAWGNGDNPYIKKETEKAVLMFDYQLDRHCSKTLYMDMPDAMQQWNRYRSAALGWYWAQQGITVVPTLSWAQPSSYRFCFKGIPKHSTVATSTVGVVRDKDAQKVWHDGMREAMKRLEPSRVLLYGKNIGFDFGGCEVVEYKAGGFHGR